MSEGFRKFGNFYMFCKFELAVQQIMERLQFNLHLQRLYTEVTLILSMKGY